MKKIIISAAMLFSTFMYSQMSPMEGPLCKVEVWNTDSSRFERSSLYESCYNWWESNDFKGNWYIAVSDNMDTTNANTVYFEVYEDVSTEELHWIRKAKQIDTGQECYIHHFRGLEHNMIRIDYSDHSIRFIEDYWEDSHVHGESY
jgi:hypothetical protein